MLVVVKMSEETEPATEALKQALQNNTPRFFRATSENAHGSTGVDDTTKFAESLMVLQECALLLGEKLEMQAITYAYMYDGEETIGFKFDQQTNPGNPEVAGAIQNKRTAMVNFSSSIDGFIENGE